MEEYMSDTERLKQSIIGKTIARVWIDGSAQHYLAFDVHGDVEDHYPDYYPGEESVYWQAEGDCCSESWVESIDGFSNLLNNRVTEFEDVDMPEVDDGLCRQEYDRRYGIRITTTKGHATVIFRNSSNGYYGGSMEPCDPPKDVMWKRMESGCRHDA